MSGYPQLIGRLGVDQPLAMAERAIDVLQANQAKPDTTFSVCIDFAGAVSVERKQFARNAHVVLSFNRRSDPDWMADEIAFVERERA